MNKQVSKYFLKLKLRKPFLKETVICSFVNKKWTSSVLIYHRIKMSKAFKQI